jgi:lipid-A-disaccharide synthase
MSDGPTIFISSAEASGDRHAAGLIRAIKAKRPDARIVGAGGPLSAEAGAEILADMTAQASMLGGPLLKLRYYRRNVRLLQRAIREIKPDVMVPVDSPALNWHLAKAAKKVDVPVMYYVAPQVWAWAPWRIKKVRKLTDHVACLLPFEESYFRDRGVAATFVGHPLFDHLPARPETLPNLADASMTGRWRVAMLPGSRPAEIASHAEAMIEVARAIRERWPQATCVMTAPTEDAAKHLRHVIDEDLVHLAVGQTAEVLADSHIAVAASGTVTLETAFYGVPMAIVYRVNMLLYHMVGKWLLRTPHLSLVNILADEKLVPELMPWNGNVPDLIDATLTLMDDPDYLEAIRERLIEITAPLARESSKACDHTADLVLSLLD